jgi:hypothetical protein
VCTRHCAWSQYASPGSFTEHSEEINNIIIFYLIKTEHTYSQVQFFS